ncbi:hypothetical protein CCHL11_02560 [Colletotrichum chlorophyti]|uniref:LEA domain protein n=1 Tax=Colletotrichum chlorophyti TaxID=708187 RepID=A0A1Q8S961_9PEZI|nr:hypothetical protein CCHL11_02560 [Colletotrichum chlorophyti]
MTASPPLRSTPPPAQHDEPNGPSSNEQTTQHSMQGSVPAPSEPSQSDAMRPTGAQPVTAAGDPDHASRHDEYEVVEVEDDEAGVEEVPRRSSSVRPPLPRLNSQSRAPSSPALGPETSQPQPHTHYTNTLQPQKGGPSHLQGSREIPIPIRTSSTQNQSTPKRPPMQPSAETADGRTDEGTQQPKQSSEKAPACHPPQEKNAPIQIPKVTPLNSGLTLPPDLAELAQGLEGKYVDEFGNILEWDGQVLGRVEGDLPSMIGRPVSATGEIFSEDGEVVGYVAENDTVPPAPPSPKPIEGMGDGLKVDHLGNILDRNNNVLGHFNGAPLAQSLQRTGQTGKPGHSSGPHPANNTGSNNAHSNNSSFCPKCNPQSKPSATPSPSEIFMDVKSTNDGIQLIIKIPTVINGGGSTNIHIGSG